MVDVWISAAPPQIVPEPLTHILYAFADTDAETGIPKLTDSWSDELMHYPGDSWNDVGNNVGVTPQQSVTVYADAVVPRGTVVVRKPQTGGSRFEPGGWQTDSLVRSQLYLLKLKKRNLKVLLSVGGWTYSQKGHFAFVTTQSKRATFINNTITFIEDYGFDGVYACPSFAAFDFSAHTEISDIDFEYPANDEQAAGHADLITEIRTALNDLASRKGDKEPYILSVRVFVRCHLGRSR